MTGWPMLDNAHCRRGHDARATDPCDELGWAHSVLDPQIVESASMSNEPAAPAAVVKIGCRPDQGPAGNLPPLVRRLCATTATAVATQLSARGTRPADPTGDTWCATRRMETAELGVASSRDVRCCAAVHLDARLTQR